MTFVSRSSKDDEEDDKDHKYPDLGPNMKVGIDKLFPHEYILQCVNIIKNTNHMLFCYVFFSLISHVVYL